jgi:hypothetical protein
MFSPAVSVREQEIEKFTPNQSFGLDPRVYQFHHSYHFLTLSLRPHWENRSSHVV